MIYVDITSSLKYRMLRPNGIVRTELECINYILLNDLPDVEFCAFSYQEKHLVIIDKTKVLTLLSGVQELSRSSNETTIVQPSEQQTIVEESTVAIVPPLSASIRTRVKRIIRGIGGRIYRRLPAEIREHFKASALEAIEMVRSTRWYFHQKKASRQQPPPIVIEKKIIPEPMEVENEVVYEPTPSLTPFEKDDVYICLGFAWDYLDLEQLYKEKISKGFKFITLAYDLIPILMPEYANGNMPSFCKAFINLIWSSEALFCISDHTMQDLQKFMEEVHAPKRIIKRIYLGSYQPHSIPSEKPSIFDGIKAGKYVLCVGTMEPRKNHELLFQIWRTLYFEHPNELIPLVIVGNLGWHTQELRSMIQLNPWLYPKHINWFSNVSDEELEWLYRNCRFTVYPSLYEGWGLPISESIDRGKLCLSSNSSSMVEAGQGITELIPPLDYSSWKEKVYFYITNDAALQEKERVIMEHRKVTNWNETFRRFFEDTKDICIVKTMVDLL